MRPQSYQPTFFENMYRVTRAVAYLSFFLYVLSDGSPLWEDRTENQETAVVQKQKMEDRHELSDCLNDANTDTPDECRRQDAVASRY